MTEHAMPNAAPNTADPAEKSRTETRLTIPEMFILSLSLVLPVIMMETWRLSMIRSVPLLLLFGLIAWPIFRSDQSRSLVTTT